MTSSAEGVRLPRSELSGSRPPRLGRPCGPSHAIGYGDPRPGTHSPGSSAYEEDGSEQSGLTIYCNGRQPYRRAVYCSILWSNVKPEYLCGFGEISNYLSQRFQFNDCHWCTMHYPEGRILLAFLKNLVHLADYRILAREMP